MWHREPSLALGHDLEGWERKGRKAAAFSLTEAPALGPAWPCQFLRGRSLEVAVCLLAGGACLSMQPEEGGSDAPLVVAQGSWAAW